MKDAIIYLIGMMIIFPSIVFGATVSYTLDGSAFSSASGQYATKIPDNGSGIRTWIEGTEVILGAFYSNPVTWTGGSAEWNFSVNVPQTSITSASLTIEWPSINGKGLHSLKSDSRIAIAKVGSKVVGSPTFTSNFHCSNDYFAFPCDVYSVTYPIPIEFVQPTTKVTLSVPKQTLWDVSRVKLSITYDDGGRIQIVGGKLYVDRNEFQVKGVDYAPWFPRTGPDVTKGHKPFPASANADVTARLTTNGKVYVRDYSGDGKIQAKEVLRFDISTMKSLGINTLRLYAAGSWHDKNLDGKIERSSDPDKDEIVQGDLPDWAVKYILDCAHNNGMMVILGYWVQEEDFKQDPHVCNWADLRVAKRSLGRIIRIFKNHPALLAWGIGNEVNGDWNHTWFQWGVQPNAYLNELFAYVRSLDVAHPVMYAKYIGEEAGFNELDADIIAVNTYTTPASELAEEFVTPVASGQAYILGEFGHLLSQATDHRALAEQYAGGCFLEFNNVWWKGGGQNRLGVVDQYRMKNTLRFNKVKAFYTY